MREDDFQRQVLPHRRALLAHCYRMLGSSTDAEDVLQDALVRAWRSLSTVQREESLRSWLYQVATNACLTALERRRSRTIPQLLGEPTSPDEHVGPPGEPERWVEPFSVEERESVTLGFVIALQQLPARQRAILLLCEVVGYEASEVAEMLGSTTTAVNSALARARATLQRARRRGDTFPARELKEEDRVVLERYRKAWEAGDVTALVSMLTREATFSMPPVSTWFQGRAGVTSALRGHVFADGRRFKLVPTTANGAPAFVVLKRERGERGFTPLAVQVVALARGRVNAVTTFLNPPLAQGWPVS